MAKKAPYCVEQLKNALVSQLYNPEVSITAALVGAPGTAKTSYIKEVAEVLGYDVHTMIASRMTPEDFNGFPGRSEYKTKGGSVEVSAYAPWDWQMEILEKKKVIIFLDEFSNARPDVAAVLLSFLQDREFPTAIDGKKVKLPRETLIVVAMNPTEESADGYDISAPMANRMSFIPWRISVADWLAAFEADFDPNIVRTQMQDIKEVNASTVKENRARWKQHIAKFIKSNQSMLHLQNDGQHLSSGEVYGMNSSNPTDRTVMENAWASARSWVNLLALLSCLPPKQQSNSSLVDRIVQSTVGVKASVEFRRYLKKAEEFDALKLLNDPHMWSDEQYATIIPEHASDLTSTIVNLDADAVTLEDFNNLTTVLTKLADNHSQSTTGNNLQGIAGILGRIAKSLPKRDESVSTPELMQVATKVLQKYRGVAENSH